MLNGPALTINPYHAQLGALLFAKTGGEPAKYFPTKCAGSGCLSRAFCRVMPASGAVQYPFMQKAPLTLLHLPPQQRAQVHHIYEQHPGPVRAAHFCAVLDAQQQHCVLVLACTMMLFDSFFFPLVQFASFFNECEPMHRGRERAWLTGCSPKHHLNQLTSFRRPPWRPGARRAASSTPPPQRPRACAPAPALPRRTGPWAPPARWCTRRPARSPPRRPQRRAR